MRPKSELDKADVSIQLKNITIGKQYVQLAPPSNLSIMTQLRFPNPFSMKDHRYGSRELIPNQHL